MPFANPITAGTILVQPAIQSPNFSQAAQTGWAVEANGSAFFYGIVTSGEFTGTNFIINSAGEFFYSATPALGNLIYSIANQPGTDAFGNKYVGGGGTQYASSTPGGFFAFGPAVFVSGTNGIAGLGLLHAATAGGPYASLGGITIYSAGGGPAQFIVSDSGSVTPATSALAEIQGALAALSAAISGASATGQILVVQNTTAGPSNSNAEIICQAGGDNALGIMVTGDTFNRVKVTTRAISMGGGAATQDVQIYRSSSGTWGADTILANVSGSAATWQTLGTLAGATVNVGQFRFLADGMVAMEIDITFAVATAVPINFSVTIPAAYRPLNAVDVRAPMAQTNAAGGIGRIFVGSTGGGSAGLVQFTTLGAGNAIGTYSAHFQYPVI